MRTIDEKIVEMRFDNRNFEENVSESISTLDKLKSKLKFSDSEKSFGNLEKAADKVGFTGIIKAVDTVQAKFSALEIAGITAMTRLTNAAIDAGEQFVKSLSVDNIAAGWDKFAKKTVSVGTLIAQGYKIDDVNRQLERLNWFTDETSYNFTDMVDNIGKFTAAGQTLENSVTAMEGIALWAAKAGQNASVASRAMYQISQAIGSGYMRRADYVSIQNANMDTQEFRQHALDAAVALGTLQKNADDTYQSLMKDDAQAFTISQFAEHLTDDLWFTSDVMMAVFRQYGQAAEILPDYIDAMGLDTASEGIAALRDIQKQAEESGKDFDEVLKEMGLDLNKFALDSFEAGQEARTFEDVILSVQDAVSTGWLNTFEKIFGDYTTQKVFWTDLANELWDVFAGGGEVRNEALTMWSELEKYGREDLFASFWDSFHAITDTIETIKKGFNLIVPTTASGKLRFLQIITSTITENVAKFAEYMDSIQNKLEARVRKISLILIKLKDAFGYVFDSIKSVADMFTTRFTETFPEVKIRNVLSLFSNLAKGVRDFAKAIRDAINDPAYNFEGIINGVLGSIGLGKEFISAVFKPLIDYAKDFLQNVDYQKIISTIGDFGDGIYDLYQRVKENDTFNKAVQSIIDSIKRFFKEVDDFVEKLTGKTVKEIFDDFIGAIVEFGHKLESLDTSGVEDGVNKIALIFSPLKVFVDKLADFVNQGKSILSKIVDFLTPLFETLKLVFQKFFEWVKEEFNDFSIEKLFDLITGFFQVFSAFYFGMGTKWLAETIDALEDLAYRFTQVVNGTKLILTSKSIQALATALLLLAIAFSLLSTIDSNGIQKGMVAMSSIVGIVIAFERILAASGLVKGTRTLLALAISVGILALAFKSLGKMDIDAIGRASLAIGVITGVIVLFETMFGSSSLFKSSNGINTLTKRTNNLAKGTGSLIAFGLAMIEFAAALKILSTMSWEELAVGGIAFVGIAAVMIAAYKIIGGVSAGELKSAFSNLVNMVAMSDFLITFATSMILMAAAFKILSTVSWEQLAPAMVAMITIFAMINGLMTTMSTNQAKAGSLLASSVAMIAIAGSILIFAGAIALLAQLDIIKLAAATLAVETLVATLAFALNTMKDPGVLAGAAAILIVAAAMWVLLPVIIAFGATPIATLITGLAALAAVLIIVGTAAALLKPGALAMLEFGAGLALVGVGVAAIGLCLTTLAAGILALIGVEDAFVKFIVVGLPSILVAFTEVLIGWLENTAPRLVDAILGLIVNVLSALSNRASEFIEVILEFIESTLITVAQHLPGILSAITDIVSAAIVGFFDYFKELIVNLVTGIVELVEAVLEAFGGMDGEKFLKVVAVFAALNVVMTEMAALVAVATIASAGLPIIGMNLSWFMENLEPFMEGIQKVNPRFLEGAKFLAEAVLALCAASVLDGLAGLFGKKTSFEDFAKDLAKAGPEIAKYGKSVSNINAAKFNASSMAVKILADVASNLPRHGGLAQWFTGDATLATFAAEMVPFGKAIAEYASSIQNLSAVDLTRITIASAAVSTLVNMAANLPKHDGVVQWFTGDNKLSVFAEEMVTFGDDLVKLSKSSAKISDDDVTNIQRATNAAKIVAEFSTTLPKHSGVVLGWFTSDNKLSDFANDLTLFGESIKNTASSVENFTDADFQNVERATNAAKIVADFSTTLPKHEGIIASWFTSDNKLSDFANELAVFGPKLMDYAKSIRELNSNDLAKINGSSAAVKAIADIATSMPQQPGALASWFTDSSMSLSKFGEELTKFAPNLKTYSNEVKELDAEAITNSADAVTAFVNVIVGLPKTDGLKDIWEGKTDLPKFGDAMVAFVPKLKEFNKEISGANIDVQSIYRAATATKYMVDAASGIKPINGFFELFTGDASLSKFGEEMVAFAPSLYTFAYNVKDINADKVKSAAYATQAMVNAMNNIKPTGGLLNKILNGEASLSKFGEELSDFGFSFYSYYLDVYNMDFDIVKQSGEAIKNLIEIINNLPEVKWFWEETLSLNDIGKDLSAFGDGFKEFYQKVQGAPEDKVGLAIKALKSFVDITHTLSELDNQVIAGFGDALGKLGTAGVTGFVNAFQNSKPLIEKTGESIVQWLLSGVTSKKTGLPNEFSAILSTIAQKVGQNDTRFFNLGKLLVDKLIEGIKSQSASISAAVTQISANVKAYLNTNRVYDKWYEAGRYLGGGLVEGINSTSAKVVSTTTAMAQSAIAAARIALGIKSPSKVFYEIGSYAGEGLVDGLINYESQVYGAGSELAEYARLGLEQAVMYANDLIQNGSDSQPTIRPVLDLSEIQNGVSQLYGMLGGDVGYDVNGSLSLAKQAAIGFGNEKNSTLGLQDAIVQMTKGINGKNGETIYNTFNISGDNAYDIAEEVSRIIQQQVERRDAVWA